MKTLIITAMLGNYTKVAEEIEKELEAKKGTSGPIKGEPSKEEEGFVSIHAFDMMSQAYDAKFDECEKLKAENKKLIAELSKYRYFIECQKNEIEKL